MGACLSEKIVQIKRYSGQVSESSRSVKRGRIWPSAGALPTPPSKGPVYSADDQPAYPFGADILLKNSESLPSIQNRPSASRPDG